jgi:DNA-binding protein H-NS
VIFVERDQMPTLQELLQWQQVLDQQIKDVRRSELTAVLANIRAQVRQFGLTASDVFPSSSSSSGNRSSGKTLGKVAPKYRDPASGKTWTGRGKTPKWIEGQERSQFII